MKYIPVSVSRKVAMAALRTRKNSPKLLFVAGVVSMGATVVTACKATLQVEEVLTDLEEKKALSDLNLKENPKYTQETHEHNLRAFRLQATLELGKLYGPSIILGATSLLCFTQAHRIQARRIAGLSAALAIISDSFDKYRERVREELGEQKDREFLFGVEEVEVQEATPNGMKKRKVKTAKGPSRYAVYYDKGNPNWNEIPSVNETFLEAHLKYANRKLHANGYLLLNDVYEALGFPKTTAGCVVGWLAKEKGGKDGYVDFGIGDWPNAEDFAYGREQSVLLEFNVDGEIYRAITPGDAGWKAPVEN